MIWGADKFVAGASALARKLGVSPLLIGLTIVAFGTSMPELAVSVTAEMCIRDRDTTARNDMGETEKVSEVDATYTKDGAELNLSAHKSYTVFTEDEMENPVPATTTEVNGVTLTYRDAHYRFVPDDYEKSDEEKQQEKSGELVISYYGSDEVEDKMFQSVLWEQDGATYLISGYDTGLDAQTMFDMAAELVK